LIWPRVIGQERVKRSLVAAKNSGRMAHAYLFYGADGVGKDAAALEFARVLRCATGGDEACGVCDSCRRMASMQHPDVRLIVPLPTGKNEQEGDEPLQRLSEGEVQTVQEQFRLKAENPYHRIQIPRANVIKISSVREIRRESSFSTSDNKTRIFIIAGADAMNDAAANTLLKTLEEPPGDTMLILTSAHREALLPTILSRCQNVRFDPLTDGEIEEALKSRNGVPAEQAALCARLANGSYTLAVELLQEDMMTQRAEVVEFIRSLIRPKVFDVTAAIDRLAETKDREIQTRFLSLMLFWFRDALVLSHGGEVINTDQIDTLRNFLAKFPSADILRAMAEVEKAISLVGRYAYIKIVLLQLAVRLRLAIVGEAAEEHYPS
jgi:DNA polymerase III subunit delta'